MKGGGHMPIQSAFNRTSYSPNADTQQRKVLQPVSAPMIQDEPNLSQPQPVKVAVTQPQEQPKPTPKAQTERAEKSTKRFALRLTSKQRQQVKKLKKVWGLSTESAVIKKLIDDSREENNSSDLSRQVKELAEIKMALNRIGVNVNQIAKKANQVQMSMDDLNAVMQYMQDVCNLIYAKELK